MTDIDRAMSRLFVPAEGGGWDYYPFGFKKPGYRADAALVDEAARIERGGSKLALIGIAAIAFLLYVILPKLAEVHREYGALANSPIIRLALAVPLLALTYSTVMIRRRGLLGKLLEGRIAQRPPLPPAAILARRALFWRATPWFSRIAMFVAIPFGALAMALYAWQRAGQADALAAWEAGIAAAFAIALVALYGLLIYRVMSFRAAALDKK